LSITPSTANTSEKPSTKYTVFKKMFSLVVLLIVTELCCGLCACNSLTVLELPFNDWIRSASFSWGEDEEESVRVDDFPAGDEDVVTEDDFAVFTVLCISLIVLPARYEIKAGRIGSIHGEKNDPKPANADTSML
jgi:hypothetical protein